MARQVLYRVLYGTSNIQNDHVLFDYAANLTILPAILPNYCRHRVRYSDYPGIIPQDGESVRGTYVAGLTDSDMNRLDYFEGAEYTRRPVQVVLLEEEGIDGVANGNMLDTETYVFSAGNDRLEMGEWDFDDFVKNKMIGRWADDHSEEYEG